MGNVLADYADVGGKVILAVFHWTGDAPWTLGGRFMEQFYSPFINAGIGNHDSTASLGNYDASHLIMQGVVTASDLYRDYVNLDPGAYLVASWSDGEEFIAAKDNAVAINSYSGYNYQWTGDMGIIFHNAVNYLTIRDVSWLSEAPVTGTIASGANQPISITFTALPTITSGVNTAALVINTSDTLQPNIYIPVTLTVLGPPTCDFGSEPNNVGQVTVFTNLTRGIGPLSYRWDFGDGSLGSAVNPTHAYTYGDLFPVMLIATNPWGQDVCTRTVSVEGPPLARFTVKSRVGLGHPATFVNTSRANPPVSTWVWDLGDGTYSTDPTPPPHYYANIQPYNVSLIAINPWGFSVYTNTIWVTEFDNWTFMPVAARSQ